MIKAIMESVMLFHYGNCKHDIHELTALKFANGKQIKELQQQVMELIKEKAALDKRVTSQSCLADDYLIVESKNIDLIKQLNQALSIINDLEKQVKGLKTGNQALQETIKELKSKKEAAPKKEKVDKQHNERRSSGSVR